MPAQVKLVSPGIVFQYFLHFARSIPTGLAVHPVGEVEWSVVEPLPRTLRVGQTQERDLALRGENVFVSFGTLDKDLHTW